MKGIPTACRPGPVLTALALMGLAGVSPRLQAQPIPVLETVASFRNPSADQGLAGSLVAAADGNLYGVTAKGGAINAGTLYRLTPAGVRTVLHSFSGWDGMQPGGLIAGADGHLYGFTVLGGAGNAGTVFRLTTAGSFTSLASVPGGAEGSEPVALAYGADGHLYGVTGFGGTEDSGTAFRVTTAGTYTRLASFTAAGGTPATLVAWSDGHLYGTTVNTSTVFRLTTAGVVSVRASFVSGQQGINPRVLVAGPDAFLYGATESGAASGLGAVFRFDPATSTLNTVLASTAALGGRVVSLSPADPDLLGTREQGVVFRLSTAGVQTTLATVPFPSGLDDATPRNLALRAPSGTIYGTASTDGLSRSQGAIFSIPSPGLTNTLSTFLLEDSPNPGSLIAITGGNFRGITAYGGTNDTGTVFQVSAGGTLSSVVSFAEAQGSFPSVLLQATGGDYFGLNANRIFRLTAGGALSTIFSFSDPANGINPNTLLQATDGQLYGTTVSGGAGGWGTLFSDNQAGTFTTLLSLDYLTQGASPGGLVQGQDGHLYGITAFGGPSDFGTVFRRTSGGVFSTMAVFDGSNGFFPSTLLQGTDGHFYGLASDTVFKMTPGGTLTTLAFLNPALQGTSATVLVQGADGALYGATTLGGAANLGTLFRVTLAGEVSTLASFRPAQGGTPTSLLARPDGTLLGTASGGYGTVFRLRTNGPVPFGSWTDYYFPQGGAGSGGQNDPDGDSASNALEYSRGTDPLVRQNQAALAPVLTTTGSPGQTNYTLQFTYSRPLDRPSASWQVQGTTNLLVWTNVPDSQISVTSTNETRRATLTVPTGTRRMMLRLVTTVAEP